MRMRSATAIAFIPMATAACCFRSARNNLRVYRPALEKARVGHQLHEPVVVPIADDAAFLLVGHADQDEIAILADGAAKRRGDIVEVDLRTEHEKGRGFAPDLA